MRSRSALTCCHSEIGYSTSLRAMKSLRSGWRRTRRFLVSDKTLFRPISTDLRPAFFAHHRVQELL